MGFKRIVAKSEQDLNGIMDDVKNWFKENATFKSKFSSEARKFMDPETKKIVEKKVETIHIVDQNSGKETSVKFIPLLKSGEMKIEIGGENESTIVGKIKNQIKDRGTLKSYSKDTKVPLKETITKSVLTNIIREEIQEILSDEKKKLDKYYDQVIELVRKAARDLNDDDAYELHEKLKTWFNKLT